MINGTRNEHDSSLSARKFSTTLKNLLSESKFGPTSLNNTEQTERHVHDTFRNFACA